MPTPARLHRLALSFLFGLLLTAGGRPAQADPAGRTYWVDPPDGYADRPGTAEWGWTACTCNPQEYRGDFCATDRDPVCGGSPANQGGIWEWETRPGYWENHPPATVAGGLTCTLGLGGWCISAATVTVSGSEPVAGFSITSIQGLDNGAAYSRPGALAVFSFGDTPGRTLTYQAVSSYGDSSFAGSLTARVDTMAPTVNASVSGPVGLGGWYRGPGQVSVSASDATSGVSAITLDGVAYAGPKLYSAQGATPYSFLARDLAGNTSPLQFGTLRIDSVPPAVSPSLSGTPGENGWFISPVQVTLTGSDAGSGLAGLSLDGVAYAGPRIYSAQGTWTFSYAASDAAGNASGTQTGTLRLDTAAPAVSASVAGTPGDNGWYTSAVVVSVNASDTASGVASVTLDGSAYSGPRAYAAQGATTVTCSARDSAGLSSAEQAASFQIDTVPPTASLTLTGPAGDAGWYTGPVTVEVNGADATSGLAGLTLNGAAYSSPQVIGTQGRSAVTYAARDNAGNASAAQAAELKIDSIPPEAVLALAGTPGADGWFVSPVQVIASATDAASGVAALVLDGAPYAGPRIYAVEGETTVTSAARDAAGNAGAVEAAVFRVDLTAPVVSATVSGPAGEAGWYTGPVTVEVIGADATSGLAALTLDGQPYSGPREFQAEGETTVAYAGRDAAGNVSVERTATFRIDATAPVVDLNWAGTPGRNGWYVSPVTVTVTAVDAASGVAGVTLAGSVYTAPRVLAEDGETTLVYTAVDAAGNDSAEQTRAFRIDTEPPVTTPTLVGLAGRGGWYLGPVLVVLSAEDAVSGVDHILLDGQLYTSPRLFAAGTVTATYQAVDEAGNVEPAHTLVFNADGTPPATTATLAGTRGEAGWFTSAVTVTVAATDDLSGVAQVWLNGQPGTALTLEAEGQHRVDFAAEDLAGNRAITQTLTIQIDQTPPDVTVTTASRSGGTLNLDVQAHDVGSGVQGGVVGILVDGQLVQWWDFAGESATVEWDGALPDGRRLPPGACTVWAAARDAAGLEATASASAMLAPAMTWPPTLTPPAPASSRPTTPPAPTSTPEPPATETPFVPSLTQAILPAQPLATQTPRPITPPAGRRSRPHNTQRGTSGPAWALLTILPALALAFGAVHVVDPRPRALRRLADLFKPADSPFPGAFDD